MKKLLASLSVAVAFAAGIHAAPIGTGFTYQGHLNDGGAPANGVYDMIFNLYDEATNGTGLGTFSIFGAVPVTNGLFTVELNSYGEFGTNAFNGDARWLQIGVRTNSNNAMNPWIHLSPRQALNSTPQAMFAQNASDASFAATVADGAITASKLASGAVQPNNLAPGALAWTNIAGVPAGFADGVDNSAFYFAGPGLNLDWLFHFSVDFAGSGTATSAARSDHGHFGSAWGGNAYFGPGLAVTNGAGNGAGLYGQQGVGSGFPYIFGNPAGVWGESSQGSGVWGASATSAGVRGISLGTNGYGVYGATIATNGANFGVYGQSASVSGTGVRGHATALSGVTSGVRGESDSSNGYGVLGIAYATNGFPTGVAGQSVSTAGVGVRGWATAATGETVGVRGDCASGEGSGVKGVASALWGDATGVCGQSAAVHGVGVFGKATFVSGVGANYGVIGQSDSLWGYGVYGHAASPSGINFGVVGESHSLGGVGVVARNTNGVGLKVEGRSIIQSDGVALKIEGSGIIQSDADSYIWIPGSVGYSSPAGNVERSERYLTVSGYNTFVYLPLTLPGIMYGQKTMLKSVEIFYHLDDPDHGFIAKTWIEEYGSQGIGFSLEDNVPRKSSASYTLPVNHYLDSTAGFFTVSIKYDFSLTGEEHHLYIHGIKVRLGHK